VQLLRWYKPFEECARIFLYLQVFQKDGFDYFTDMMPALHNYVTVDTPIFLSNENYILAMFNICKAVSICVSAFASTNTVCWYMH